MFIDHFIRDPSGQAAIANKITDVQIVINDTGSTIIPEPVPEPTESIVPHKDKTFMQALTDDPIKFIAGGGFIILIANAITGGK